MNVLKPNPRPDAQARLFFLRRHLLHLLVALFMAGLAATGRAELRIQMVSEVSAIVAGQPFYVGLFLQHEPKHHTYWKQPGLVGAPTFLKWELPPGFQGGELEFPAPERVPMFHFKAQGFERDVLLQCLVTPPSDLQPGSKVTLAGLASWLYCLNVCTPGYKRLEITLPVAAAGSKPAWDPQWKAVFDSNRAATARPSQAWTATAKEKDRLVVLTLAPVAGAGARAGLSPEQAAHVIFFTEDGWIDSNEPQEASPTPEGGLILTLRRAEIYIGDAPPGKLHGVLQLEAGWLADGTLPNLLVAPTIDRD